MSSMPWIKVYTDILDDHKIGRLPDNLKWRFIQLCVLAGECDAEGYIVNGIEPMTIGDMAWRLRLDSALLAEDLQMLKDTGLMETDDGAWLIINFSKRQGRSQEEKRKLWRERQQRKRGRDKENDVQESHDAVTGDSPVTHGSREEERRGENKNHTRTADAVRRRKPTEKEQQRAEIERYFLSKTGLPVPKRSTEKQKRAAGEMFWQPIDELLEFCGDIDSVKQLIDQTVVHMRSSKLTISSVKSILNPAKSLWSGGQVGIGDEKFAEEFR